MFGMPKNKLFVLFQLQIVLYSLSEKKFFAIGAVAPPPWADPKVNPCAIQPRGWQLLYWKPDGKCYKIFKMGYPCPDDMELSPAATSAGVREFSAECRCPPKSAQSTYDGRCYELFKVGSCQRGQYFVPDTRNHTESEFKKQHWGVCLDAPKCENHHEIYWPQNGRCYEKLTKGPCTKGQLITLSSDGSAVCSCNQKTDMIDYFYDGYGCFQHFTKGPCKEKGHLFLPNRSCDCSDELPHYHDVTKQCFEIVCGECGSEICRSGSQNFALPMIRMEELLIEKVKQRELLFNTRCRDYKDQLKRCEAWEEIGKELNMSGDFAKDAWERLRRCYTNALHRRRFKKSSKRIFPWKFEKEMSFLLPFLELRKSRYDSSLFVYDDNQDTTIDDELHIKEDVENGDIDTQDNLVESLRTHFMDQVDVDRRCENLDRRESTPNDMEQRYTESYPYVKPIYQQMCSIPPVMEGLDETDMFYLSMSRMTKRLPKLEQAKIKLILSKSVLEAEIRQESGDPQIDA